MTPATERHLYCGSSDVPLSPEGRKELIRKKNMYRYPDPEGCSFYTSGMRRTEETLELLYGPVSHGMRPDLKEMDFGEFEMHTYDELRDMPSYIAWITGDNDENVCPGGESGAVMEERAAVGFRQLLASGCGDLVIVTHGGPCAAVMRRLFPEQGRNRYEWQPKPGEGYEILFDGEKPCSFSRIPEGIQNS